MSTQLLFQSCPEGCDPLGPENPIVFAVGPLIGLFPLASKTVTMFKSPHTGNLGESHCGGSSAVAIRMAGYGAIAIEGKSEIPIYLAIHGSEVYFRDASTLWGMSSSLTVGHIIRERESGSGLRTIMRIGLAGERMVTYSCVAAETYRNVYKGIHEAATSSEAMKKYHDIGTAQNILPLNKLSGLPTRNLQETKFEGAEEISGEAFAEKYLGRRLACSHCPVACIHIAALARGVEHASSIYGGEEFALALGRNEMPGYHTGPAAHVGCLMGTRHSHREKLRFKTREGFTFDGLRIPERILKTKSPASGLSEEYIRATLDHVRKALV